MKVLIVILSLLFAAVADAQEFQCKAGDRMLITHEYDRTRATLIIEEAREVHAPPQSTQRYCEVRKGVIEVAYPTGTKIEAGVRRREHGYASEFSYELNVTSPPEGIPAGKHLRIPKCVNTPPMMDGSWEVRAVSGIRFTFQPSVELRRMWEADAQKFAVASGV